MDINKIEVGGDSFPLLLHGDCLELMKDIPDESIDMILCDLPYSTTRNEWDSIIPLNDLWDQYERIVKDNASIVLFSQMPFTAKLVNSKLKYFRYEWIWKKAKATGYLNAKKMPLKEHENILVFYKKLPVYNPQWEWGKPYEHLKKSPHSGNYGKQKDNIAAISDGRRYPKDILTFSYKESDRHLHPTQKPVALLEYLIKTYTNEGEVILDNCMGSGSTGVACMNTNRRFIGIEKEEKYFNIARERITGC